MIIEYYILREKKSLTEEELVFKWGRDDCVEFCRYQEELQSSTANVGGPVSSILLLHWMKDHNALYSAW